MVPGCIEMLLMGEIKTSNEVVSLWPVVAYWVIWTERGVAYGAMVAQCISDMVGLNAGEAVAMAAAAADEISLANLTRCMRFRSPDSGFGEIPDALPFICYIESMVSN